MSIVTKTKNPELYNSLFEDSTIEDAKIVSEEELIEVLRQFDEKRVEELPEKTRNIFYAIMKIADERDEYIHLYESTLKDLDIAVKNKIELENIINEAIGYIKNNKETREHYEPYGTPMGNSNYTTAHIFGYYELLDILNKGEKK